MNNEPLELPPDDLPDSLAIPGHANGPNGLMQSDLHPYEPVADGLYAQTPEPVGGMPIPDFLPEPVVPQLPFDPNPLMSPASPPDSVYSPPLFAIPNSHTDDAVPPALPLTEPPASHMLTIHDEDLMPGLPEEKRPWGFPENHESPNEILTAKSGTTWSDSDYPYAPKPRRGRLKAYRDKSAGRLQSFGLRKNTLKISNRCVLCGRRYPLAYCRDCLDKMFCCVCHEQMSDGKCINISCFMGRNNVCAECGNVKPCACEAG